MAVPRGVVAGLTTAQVAVYAQVPVSTLNYWVKQRIVTPTLIRPSGQAIARLWSVRDSVVVKTVKALRDSGCPMQQVRRARKLIGDLNDEDFDSFTMFWDGHSLRLIDDMSDIAVAVGENSGQAMFASVVQFLALPIGHWRQGAIAMSDPIDITEYRRKYRERALSRAARRTRTAVLA